MPIHDDHITFIERPEDQVYLRTRLLPVSLRLYRSSPGYRSIIQSCIQHLKTAVLTKAEGYKLPHGMSGANLALPFNLIAITRQRGTSKAWAEVMINPEILSYGLDKVVSESNCGSIRLKEPIQVERSSQIRVRYWDEDGQGHVQTRLPVTGSLTIQHEVDHNLGILITDKSRRPACPVQAL